MTSLISATATEHRNDLLRAAAARRRRAATRQPRALPTSYEPGAVVLRQGHGDDDDVRRLAELDDARSLEGGVLIAVLDGEAVAALSLEDGRVVANPFRPTIGPVSLLRLRAEQIESRPRPRRRWARLRLRLA